MKVWGRGEMEGPQSAEMLVMFWIPGMSHRLLLCTRNRREQTVNESLMSIIAKIHLFILIKEEIT